jgi:repressor LexA
MWPIVPLADYSVFKVRNFPTGLLVDNNKPIWGTLQYSIVNILYYWENITCLITRLEQVMGQTEALVKARIKDLYGSVASFSRATDIPYSTINNVLTRGLGGSGIDTVIPMCKALGLDPMALSEQRVSELNSDPDFIDVPLYGSIAAGTPIEMITIEDYVPIPRQVAERYPNAFLLKVQGESMNKRIPNYSYALINPIDEAIDGKAHAICVNGHDATIKRVHVLANGFELLPDSTDPTYKPTIYDYGEENTEVITIIGRVVWVTYPFDFDF